MKNHNLIFLGILVLGLLTPTIGFSDTLDDSFNTCRNSNGVNCNGVCTRNEVDEILLTDNNAPTDATDETTIRNACNERPDKYKIRFYKVGMCTSSPLATSGTTNPTGSEQGCYNFFDKSSETLDSGGTSIILTNNADGNVSADVSLAEGVTDIDNGSYDLENANNYSSQGFPAVDYMLNGIGADDTAILNRFTNDVKYSNYLTSIVNKMVSNTETVVNDWNNYRTTFIGSTKNTASSSVNKLINDFIYYYEKGLRANKVGIPAGVFSGAPLMGNVEAFYKKDVSKDLLLEAMNASIKFYSGTSFDGFSSGPSLKSYLAHLNTQKGAESLSITILSKLESAKTSINSLSNSFIDQIESENNKMLVTYDAIQAVVVLLKVDMLQAFNINVDYTDADGD